MKIEPMSAMRRRSAQQMVESKHPRTSRPSSRSTSRAAKLRNRVKARFEEQYRTKLTYLPFILRATIACAETRPLVNASIVGDDVVFHKEVNLGIAVALDWGLIVPVIRRADDPLPRGARARERSRVAGAGESSSGRVTGGTFTVTNHGSFGSLFATPVINQPQVAIMGVGTIESARKSSRCRTDRTPSPSRRWATSLTFDHRLIDGSRGDAFVNSVKSALEGTWRARMTLPFRPWAL